MSDKQHQLTLGIEEEFQIIDPETRELRSYVEQILDDEQGRMTLKENVKAEMHQSVVELGTDICNNVDEARNQVIRLRSDLAALAEKKGLKIASAGTHPFSHWDEQKITEGERYKVIVEDLQQIARSNLIFGLHVHVGIPDRVSGIQVMNQARYFLPHLFALSTNSPFWLGRDTGFKGYRLKVFERFPRTGIPDAFESISEYEDYLRLLVKTTCIDNAKKIWWDIRLHPFFNTLEFRVCDAQTRVDDTIALASLMQAIVCKLYKLQRQNMTFRVYRRRLIDENRWRACRYGLDGNLIDFGRESEFPERSLLHELLDFVSVELAELGGHQTIAHVESILSEGSGADRQLAAWKKADGNLGAVVDHITRETYENLYVREPQAKSPPPAMAPAETDD